MNAQLYRDALLAQLDERTKQHEADFTALRDYRATGLSPEQVASLLDDKRRLADQVDELDDHLMRVADAVGESVSLNGKNERSEIDSIVRAIDDLYSEKEELKGKLAAAEQERGDIEYERDEAARNARRYEDLFLGEKEARDGAEHEVYELRQMTSTHAAEWRTWAKARLGCHETSDSNQELRDRLDRIVQVQAEEMRFALSTSLGLAGDWLPWRGLLNRVEEWVATVAKLESVASENKSKLAELVREVSALKARIANLESGLSTHAADWRTWALERCDLAQGSELSNEELRGEVERRLQSVTRNGFTGDCARAILNLMRVIGMDGPWAPCDVTAEVGRLKTERDGAKAEVGKSKAALDDAEAVRARGEGDEARRKLEVWNAAFPKVGDTVVVNRGFEDFEAVVIEERERDVGGKSYRIRFSNTTLWCGEESVVGVVVGREAGKVGAEKRWDPLPRNDPLKTGPGSRTMGKDAWDKAGLSNQDVAHASRMLEFVRMDPEIDEFETYDIARVLKNYRERYERAERVVSAVQDVQQRWHAAGDHLEALEELQVAVAKERKGQSHG